MVYSPIGFAKQIYAKNGIFGFWHAVGATMLQRMWFGAMYVVELCTCVIQAEGQVRFGSYDVMMRFWRQNVQQKDGSYGPRLKEGTANFVSGGMSSSKLLLLSTTPYKEG